MLMTKQYFSLFINCLMLMELSLKLFGKSEQNIPKKTDTFDPNWKYHPRLNKALCIFQLLAYKQLWLFQSICFLRCFPLN